MNTFYFFHLNCLKWASYKLEGSRAVQWLRAGGWCTEYSLLQHILLPSFHLFWFSTLLETRLTTWPARRPIPCQKRTARNFEQTEFSQAEPSLINAAVHWPVAKHPWILTRLKDLCTSYIRWSLNISAVCFWDEYEFSCYHPWTLPSHKTGKLTCAGRVFS